MLFAAHESFHIREGWLRKGLLGIERNPYLFSEEHAGDELGVGRNMVAAIRYWLQAAGLAVGVSENTSGKRTVRLEETPLASLSRRYDPYFEDEGTLWLLHYHLATNFQQTPSWSWFFNRFGVRHFTQDLFLTHLQRFVETNAKQKVSPRSLEKDCRCFVRTYARTVEKTGAVSPEESFDCPLSSLNLLEHLPKTKSYRLLAPHEESLPELIVAYALVRMREGIPLMNNEVSFRDALYGEGSPGRIFNLDPEALYSYLIRLDERHEKFVTFTRTAGLNLITLHTQDSKVVLERYYSSIGGDA
ncbi:MAG: DUF4007 family protein [Deltaproteobacteria bacterium]|nr:DUF4007 family protein [Deltaproteobacteria bacterium]